MNDNKFKLVMGTTVFWMITVAGVTIAHMWFNPPAGVVTVEPIQSVSIDPLPPPAPVVVAPKPVPKPVVLPKAPRLTKMFDVRYKITVSKRDYECLAKNLYYEARGESVTGKIAVASVTWNRVRSRRWGSTFCDVVFAPRQFSWTFQDVRFKAPAGKEWTDSKTATVSFLRGKRVEKLGGSDHYHERKISPHWNQTMKPKGIVGRHIFYVSNP